jgi:hypothetical protein
MLVYIFITKPMISMINILTPEAFTTHRNHAVRILVLATELQPNQSLAGVPVTALPSMFNPSAYHMACREHKRAIRLSIIDATATHTTLTNPVPHPSINNSPTSPVPTLP